MKRLFFLNLILLVSKSVFPSPAPMNAKKERHIVVVTASYNNADYYMKNLSSVFDQKYENYHLIYVNDCSQDNTSQLVTNYIAQRGMQDKVLYINNVDHRYALANQYRAVHVCKPTDIVVILDGDDWLANADVFAYLNEVYSDSNVWTTFGQFIQYPSQHRGWCKALPDDVVAANSLRSYTHAPSHLRTFYAQLFHNIMLEDLFYENDFFHMTGDNAFTLPIYEMAGVHHKFIEKVVMVYNIGNPINDHKKVPGLQQKLDQLIRSRSAYKPLDALFSDHDC